MAYQEGQLDTDWFPAPRQQNQASEQLDIRIQNDPPPERTPSLPPMDYGDYGQNKPSVWGRMGSTIKNAARSVLDALPAAAQFLSSQAAAYANDYPGGFEPLADMPGYQNTRLTPPEIIPRRSMPQPSIRQSGLRLMDAYERTLEQRRTDRLQALESRRRETGSGMGQRIAQSHFGLTEPQPFDRQAHANLLDFQPRQSDLNAARFASAPNQAGGWVQEDHTQIQRHLAHAQKPVSWQEQARKWQARQEAALKFAGNFTQQALDFLILDDLRTLQNPGAPVWAKGLALASFFPVGKVIKGGKLLAKVTGKSDDVLRYLAQKGLNPQQIKKYKEFVSSRGKGLPIQVYSLPNGGKVFEAVRPGRVPGRYAHWEQYIDKNGKTIIHGKRSYDSKGHFEHWHENMPFKELELPTEEKYLIRIKQLIEYNKL